MALKRTTRSTPAATTTTTTTVTDARLKALIYQGVANALATRDANRSRNGEDSHDSGSFNGGRLGSMRYKTRDTLVVVILEVICIKDLVALHFGETFVMD
ncbi:hypothetical protein Tco_0788899 [Tanacetum coccineum]